MLFRKALLHVRLLLRKRTLLDSGWPCLQGAGQYFREKVPLREIARRTGLSRNTVRSWLRQTDAVEPKYPKRVSP
ncbi:MULTISPECIES: helix-turn-helix domain-containing protein, partial [Burkholderia]|uniref:helix-turn-helix domain-containing protein n=1 Tax=Burkholderia TaxID=32008 RepID=UPI001FB943D0